MRRALAALVLVAALLAAATPVLAEGGGRGKSEDDHGRPAERLGLGRFQVESRSHDVHGRFVAFTYNGTGVSGFAAQGATLFDAVVLGADAAGANASSENGAMIRVRAHDFSFTAHDNPVAVARLETERGAVLTFPAAVTLTPKDEHQVTFTVANLTGEIRAKELNLTGQTLRVGQDVLLYLDAPQGSFDQHRSDISEAIGTGHVGAEATFNRQNGNLTQDVVSYGNVTMTTLRAEKGNLTVQIEGHGTEGRVLVLNVDNGVLGAIRKDDLTVTLDNLTIRQADNLTDALDPDNDGYAPEYYVVYDPAADVFQMIVSVPHYSVHTLSVATLIEEIPPSVLAGVVLGVVVLVPSAFVLFRRPKA